jgi:hypothetical protein
VSFADGKVEAQWRREGKGVRRRKESMSTERSPAEKVRGGHRRQTGVHVRGKEEGKKDGRSLDWGKLEEESVEQVQDMGSGILVTRILDAEEVLTLLWRWETGALFTFLGLGPLLETSKPTQTTAHIFPGSLCQQPWLTFSV